MKKHMYRDKGGEAIMIVTDREFLSRPCREVQPDEDIEHIISDLLRTARGLNECREGLKCLGLSANQLGYDVRVFVMRTTKGGYKPFINPEVLDSAGQEITEEICYSRPNKRGKKTTRANFVKVKARNVKITKYFDKAAIVFQHELDHLNGVNI
jgi:peptide deformylase